MKHFVFLMSALMVAMFVGCGNDNPVIVDEPQVMPAPFGPPSWWDDFQMNQKILTEANKWLDKWGGQCKPWVSTVVKKSTGRELPATYYVKGATYRDAKWVDGPSVRVVWQGVASPNLTRFPGLMPGQIIQLRWKDNVKNVGGGPHTVIIFSVTANTMMWIDSNYVVNMVKAHEFYLTDWNAKIAAWTVYQVQ